MGQNSKKERRTLKLKFVLLPEVNGISEYGTAKVVRLYINFSLLLGNILILVAALRCCFDCSSSLCFVDATFDLKLIPTSQKSKLSDRKSRSGASATLSNAVRNSNKQ